MKKGTMMVLSALLMSCFLAVPAEAKSIGKDTYRVCKNDIFIDYDQLNCKKIVMEVKDDGSFTAVDLGEWLEEQDIYDISIIEDDENTGYKKTFYERNPEKESADEFYDSENTSYIDFQGLVYVGDVIRSTDSSRETVTKVKFDGSFYTETEMTTDLYVDEETDSDFFDEETMYNDDSSDTDIGSGQYVYEYDMADGSHLYLGGSELSVPPTTIYIVDADGKTTQIK